MDISNTPDTYTGQWRIEQLNLCEEQNSYWQNDMRIIRERVLFSRVAYVSREENLVFVNAHGRYV